MDNIEKSNTRFEEEKIDTKRENALIESRYFHTTIQPIIRKLFDLILEKDKSLFDYNWSYDIFTDESVRNPPIFWTGCKYTNSDLILHRYSSNGSELCWRATHQG
jgi:hypothetical protein